MKTLILYDSVFGNTQKVAEAMGAALGPSARVVKISNATSDLLTTADFIVVGSPTRGFKPTEAVVTFLKALPAGSLSGKTTAAFDTRIPPESIKSRFFRAIVVRGGYADRVLTDLLRKAGAAVLPSTGFFVDASEGPLSSGELERAATWIKGISLPSAWPGIKKIVT